MNVELLQKVKSKILAEPKNFDMRDWKCGTVCCICGHAGDIAGITQVSESFDFFPVEEALGISEEEAGRLFLVDYWPQQLSAAFDRAVTKKKRAKIACDRIDHFIATKGRE